MADYEKMYYVMMDASEKAINILIEAQRKCEELYMDAELPRIVQMFPSPEKKE